MVNQVLQTSLQTAVAQTGGFPVSASTSVMVFLGSRSTFSAQTCLSLSALLPGEVPTQGGGTVEAYIIRYLVEPSGGGIESIWTAPNQPNQVSNIANGVGVQFMLVVSPYEGLGDYAAAGSIGTIFVES